MFLFILTFLRGFSELEHNSTFQNNLTTSAALPVMELHRAIGNLKARYNANLKCFMRTGVQTLRPETLTVVPGQTADGISVLTSTSLRGQPQSPSCDDLSI